jgi:hypothetical protein
MRELRGILAIDLERLKSKKKSLQPDAHLPCNLFKVDLIPGV